MKVQKIIKDLCKPAHVYLIVSIFSIFILMYQNFGNTNKFCVGSYSCYASSLGSIFLAKILYVAFWTFVINSICEAGHTNVAWFMVLIPIILITLMIILFILKGTRKKK